MDERRSNEFPVTPYFSCVLSKHNVGDYVSRLETTFEFVVVTTFGLLPNHVSAISSGYIYGASEFIETL